MHKAFAYGDRTMEPAVRRVNAMRRIAVIGAGTMGQGIAADLLRKTALEVVLLDVSQDALDRAAAWLARLWESDAKAGRLRPSDAEALRARTITTRNYADLRGSDVVWEAATERASVKKGIFERLEETLDAEALAAVFSNTSSHTTGELAVLFRAEAFREKFLTVHGYFPFEANRLIDVMKGPYALQETFAVGVVFAGQLLEKTVVALPVDHHGYVTDPIFQAMGAIISWDVRSGHDITSLGAVWELFTANPFNVLDQTGHMPFTESSRHCGEALPPDDRMRPLYDQGGRRYPAWIERLEQTGRTGLNSGAGRGFFAWSDGSAGRPRPQAVYDPASDDYVPLAEPSRRDFWSFYDAAERDRRAGAIKSAESLVHVASAADAGGRAFRRYVLPVFLYALDMIQDGYATPGQVNLCTRAGLRFKVGLIEAIDALASHLTVEGLLELVRRARDENADDAAFADMLDTEGARGPRRGKPCLLHEMRRRNVGSLLGYGPLSRTPVAELDLAAGEYRGFYSELALYEPTARDRTASIVFNCPMRGNVFNRAVIDQLAHAWRRLLDLHRAGRCGAVLFTAAGTGMRMLGADAREFNRGWFEREKGYVPLTAEQAAASSRNAVSLFRSIQRSPLATIGLFGEKWGGGAEFTYFLDMRYDLRTHGMIFDPLTRVSAWGQRPNYNQPELDYAILPGFGAAGELRRLGLGDAAAFELFDQGMTADRAMQVGLTSAVFDDEAEALARAYERARQMAKDAPYSRALFKKQLARAAGPDPAPSDEALARETAETFDPRRNAYIRSGLLRLLDRGGRPPPMDYTVNGAELPGWRYPSASPLSEPTATTHHDATSTGGAA